MSLNSTLLVSENRAQIIFIHDGESGTLNRAKIMFGKQALLEKL